MIENLISSFERVPFFGLALVVLGVLIFVHELGHFLVAKLFGVGALEFAIGFGRPLLRFQGRETTYTLRMIPLGGFVRMVGEDPRMLGVEPEEGSPADAAASIGDRNSAETDLAQAAQSKNLSSPLEGTQEELTPAQQAMVADEGRWFTKKPYLVRCAVIVAGPVANFLFAWVVAAGMYFALGFPEQRSSPVMVGAVFERQPAAKAGVKQGDIILRVNGEELQTFGDLIKRVQSSKGQPLTVELKRPVGRAAGADPVQYETQQVVIHPTTELAELDGTAKSSQGEPVYRIGVTPAVVYVPASFGDALIGGASLVKRIIVDTGVMLGRLVVGDLSPKDALGGPLEIVNQTARSAEHGPGNLLMMMVLINIALGVMNLLPIPVLDGGQIFLLTIELIKGSPLSARVHAVATQVGMVFILALMLFAFGNDLRRFFFL